MPDESVSYFLNNQQKYNMNHDEVYTVLMRIVSGQTIEIENPYEPANSPEATIDAIGYFRYSGKVVASKEQLAILAMNNFIESSPSVDSDHPTGWRDYFAQLHTLPWSLTEKGKQFIATYIPH
jgi:hypothetical protein